MKSDRATAIRQHLIDRGNCRIAEIAIAHRERINLPLKRAIRGGSREVNCIPGMDRLNTLMLGLTPADAP